MTVTDTGTPVPFRSLAAELNELASLLDLMRHTAVSSGTWASGGYTYHCGSTEEVDAAASVWSEALKRDIRGRWTADGTQYRAQAGDDRWIAAMYMPPVPVTLAEAATGSAA